MQDFILLAWVFLEGLGVRVHSNSFVYPHPAVSPRNPLSFSKVTEAQLLSTTQKGGLRVVRVGGML